MVITNILVAWIMIMILIVTSIWIYTIGSYVIIDNLLPALNPTVEELDNTGVTEAVESVKVGWFFWILVLIFGLVFVGFALTQKREYSPEVYS